MMTKRTEQEAFYFWALKPNELTLLGLEHVWEPWPLFTSDFFLEWERLSYASPTIVF